MKISNTFLYALLDRKNSYWIVILIAFSAKAILTAVFSNYEGDKSFYLLLAQSLGDGKGFSVPVSLLSNPSVTDHVYIPSAVSPLYSFLAMPLLKIFPGNFFLVTWIIESLSWLLLFIMLYRILKLLVGINFWCNVFILFSGFFLYNVELSSSSKDVLATALVFVALLQCLRITGSSNKISTGQAIIFAVLFILPGLVKYTYLPLVLVFPFALLFTYFINRQNRVLRAGLLTGLFSVLFLIVHYVYFRSLETTALNEHAVFYTNRWSLAKSGEEFIPGFYPENLLRLYPFTLAAFFNLDVGGIWVRTLAPSLYNAYGLALFFINILGIATIAALFVYVARKYFRKPVTSRISFFLIGSIISFSMLFLASALSLRYHAIEYKGSISSWTYVFENRPFIFSILFIQLGAFIFLVLKPAGPVFFLWLRRAILTLAIFAFIHGFYFIIKAGINPASVKPKTSSVNKLAVHDAGKFSELNPGKNVWIATEMQPLDWYAKLKGIKLLNHLSYLNDTAYKLPPNTILLTVVPQEDRSRLSSYLSSGKIDSSWNYDNTWFVYLEKN